MTSDTPQCAPAPRCAGLLFTIAAALLIAGCGIGTQQDASAIDSKGSPLDQGDGWTGGGSSVELPERFSHDEHFSHFASVDCALCHQSVHGSGGGSFLPTSTVCLNCHGGDMDEWAHQFHLGLGEGIACLDCHSADAATTVSESPVCLACHTRGSP